MMFKFSFERITREYGRRSSVPVTVFANDRRGALEKCEEAIPPYESYRSVEWRLISVEEVKDDR